MPWWRRRLSVQMTRFGCCLIVLMGGTITIFMPEGYLHIFRSNAALARERTCNRNSKELGLALLMYSQDWDDTFPPSSHWADQIDKFIPEETSWHCPSADTAYSYAMNSAAGSSRLNDMEAPDETVLLFEMDTTVKNASGGFHNVVKIGRHGANIFLMMTGHTKQVYNEGSKELLWQTIPQQKR